MMRAGSRVLARRLTLGGTALALVALALFLYWLSPSVSNGTGTGSLNGVTAIVNLSFAGACNPGVIATPVSNAAIDSANPVLLPVTTPVANCISRAGCPDPIVVGGERFTYANVSALVNGTPETPVIPAGGAGAYSASLPAVDLPAPPPNNLGCLGQSDLQNTFPPSGQIYIDDELFTYSGKTPTSQGKASLVLTGRSGGQQHNGGSLIRAANLLQLLSRAAPKYPASSYQTPTPTFAAHAPGESVRSPKTYNTCRVLLSQATPPLGAVTATSVCYYIQEPGYNETLCATPAVPAPAACFWPVGGMPQNYAQSPIQYWTAPSVTDNGNSTVSMTLTAQVPNIGACAPYISSVLWAKTQMTITLNESLDGKSYSGGSGTFAIKLYKSAECDSVGPGTPVPTPAVTLTDSSPNVGAAPAPSMLLKCAVDVQASAHALCYINSLTTTNNKPAATSSSCPPANVKYCGDAIFAPPGCAQASQLPVPVACLALPAATPSRHDCAGLGSSTDPSIACDVNQYQYLHVDKSMSLTVAGDSSTKTLLTSGCIQDPHGHQPLGAVYISSMTIDPRTGSGSATIYTNQPSATCSGSPIGGGPLVIPVQVTIERSKTAGANAVLCDGGSGHPQPMPGTTNQCRNGDSFGTCFDPAAATTLYCRDSDGDGCFDKDELQAPTVGSALSAAATASDTTIHLVNAASFSSTSPSWAVIDSEILSYTGKLGNDLTGVVRGVNGTGAAAHAMGAIVTEGALNVARLGGMRDPQNPYDYPDMPVAANKHKIRVDDVTYVVNRFRHDMNLVPAPSSNPYDPKADHAVLPGNNAGETWHLGPPNGQIRVDDVTAVVNSFRHDCN